MPCILPALFPSVSVCRLCVLRVVLPLHMLTVIVTVTLPCHYAGNTHTQGKSSLCAELGARILHSALSPARLPEQKGTAASSLPCETNTLHCFCDPREDLRPHQSLWVNQHARAVIICTATVYFLYFHLFHCVHISTNRNSLHRLILLQHTEAVASNSCNPLSPWNVFWHAVRYWKTHHTWTLKSSRSMSQILLHKVQSMHSISV